MIRDYLSVTCRSRRAMCIAGTIVCVIALRAGLGASQGRDKDMTVREVLASDIGRRVDIVGSLGRPLFTVVKLRGTWYMPGPLETKDPKLTLRLVELNGVRLDHEVEYPIDLVSPAPEHVKLEPADGREWEILGFESGEFTGWPKAVWEAMNFGFPQQPHGGGFMTRLFVISYKVVDE